MVNSTVSLKFLDSTLSSLNIQINYLYRQVKGFDEYLEYQLCEMKEYIYDLKKELKWITTDNEKIKEQIKEEVDRITLEFYYLRFYSI